MTPGAASTRPAPSVRAARSLLGLCLLGLAFMQPAVPLLGFTAVPGDFLFAALFALGAVLVLLGPLRPVVDRAYWFIGAYFLAMFASAAASPAPAIAAAKLATQAYLLALPLILCSLVRDESSLRSAIRWWLGGTALVAASALVSLALFAVAPAHRLLDLTLYHFGTLPPGDYPRLRLTFLNANLACNYLTVSLALALAARHNGWIDRAPFAVLLGGILLAATATISPGLGGIVLALGVWLWLALRERNPALARPVLAATIAVALAAIAALALTPILHPTAPYWVRLPLLDLTLAPSGRLMTWSDAFANFLDRPILGRGIGSDAAAIAYRDPSGGLQHLTDAHNMFLNIAAQCGIVGLAALCALIVHAAARTLPLRLPRNAAGTIRLAAGLGLLNGLVYQGLGGSFEDARHLWVLFGLLLAADRIERAGRPA